MLSVSLARLPAADATAAAGVLDVQSECTYLLVPTSDHHAIRLGPGLPDLTILSLHVPSPRRA